MNTKTFLMIVLLLVISIALPTCKRKETSGSAKSRTGRALHLVASNGKRTADVEQMLANGADVNSKDKSGMTPLHIACFFGHIGTVQVLIRYGADVNAVDDKGETPLHLAAEGGWPEVIQLLLDEGADTKAKTNEGHTPLDVVEQRQSLGIVRAIPHFSERYEDCKKLLKEGVDGN